MTLRREGEWMVRFVTGRNVREYGGEHVRGDIWGNRDIIRREVRLGGIKVKGKRDLGNGRARQPRENARAS